MDELAQQDHTYHLSKEEFRRYQGQWYLTVNKSGKHAPMRLRQDSRAPVSLKNRLYRESGEEVAVPISPQQYRRWYSSSSDSWMGTLVAGICSVTGDPCRSLAPMSPTHEGTSVLRYDSVPRLTIVRCRLIITREILKDGRRCGQQENGRLTAIRRLEVRRKDNHDAGIVQVAQAVDEVVIGFCWREQDTMSKSSISAVKRFQLN